MKFNFNIKQGIFLLLGYLLCVAVTYYLDDILFWRLEYEIRDSHGNPVFSDFMQYHVGALLLLILWELKKLNAKFKNDSDAEDE